MSIQPAAPAVRIASLNVQLRFIIIFNQGLDKRKAIYALFPQAVPNTRAIDPTQCLYLTKKVCRKCEKPATLRL